MSHKKAKRARGAGMAKQRRREAIARMLPMRINVMADRPDRILTELFTHPRVVMPETHPTIHTVA